MLLRIGKQLIFYDRTCFLWHLQHLVKIGGRCVEKMLFLPLHTFEREINSGGQVCFSTIKGDITRHFFGCHCFTPFMMWILDVFFIESFPIAVWAILHAKQGQSTLHNLMNSCLSHATPPFQTEIPTFFFHCLQSRYSYNVWMQEKTPLLLSSFINSRCNFWTKRGKKSSKMWYVRLHILDRVKISERFGWP